MELTSAIIHGFVKTLLWSKFDNPVDTPKFHFDLWDLACSDTEKVAIAAPRFHAKSTAITHCFVLACVLFKVRDYVLIISDTEGQAKEFLGDIHKELVENTDLIELFGITKIIRGNETDVIARFSTGKEFRIMAYGAGQRIRGRKWRGKRPNLVICDDLENDEAILNEETRYKFRTWFLNALLRAGSKDCLFRVVGTILHQDSMLSRLMPKMTSTTLETDGLKFWDAAHEAEVGWKALLYQAHNEDMSLILWPENYDAKYFTDMRQVYIAQGHPEGYSQEVLNRPIDASQAYFRMEDLKPIKNYDEYLEKYAGADLAVSTKDQRAYTAIGVAGRNASGVLKVIDMRRFRGDSLAICDELFSVQEAYNPELFAVENENIAKAIGPFLYEQMGRNGKPFINIREMPLGNQDKLRRARSLQAMTRAGKIEFDTKASWWPALQEELLYFPRGTYADQVDALAWICIMLTSMTDVPDDAERAEDEYQDEMNETLTLESRGVCATTGY